MGMVVSDSGGSNPAPAGTHVAICIGYADLGTQKSSFKDDNGQDKAVRKVRIMWELCDEKRDDGKPFTTSATYTASLGDKATLRKHLESWRGRAFSAEELKRFDLDNIVGKPCQLTIIHEQNQAGGIRDKISGIPPLHTSMRAPAQVTPSVIFLIDEWNDAKFSALPAFIQKWILESPEAISKRPNLAHPSSAAHSANAPAPVGAQSQHGPGSYEPDGGGGDIPF